MDRITKFFKDKHGDFAIVQRPNIWIISWAGLSLLSRVTEGRVTTGLSLLAKLALLVWAYLEITTGSSMFRRVLGAVVMGFTVFGLVNLY